MNSSHHAEHANSLTEPHRVGMLSFLVSEVAFFGTLLAVYIAYIGQTTTGPKPDVLSLPLAILGTVFLVASSFTVHFADHSLKSAKPLWFRGWWLLTIIFGAMFLVVTAIEWKGLIEEHGLTIATNIFGTTYYTVVGFHAAHLTVGLLAMLIILGLECSGQLTGKNAIGAELISWYWHFVDGVWIFVFTIVYLIGR